ncbi:MAG: hypothetical protein ACYTFO_10390 [Planctomycetota bacterium]
MTNETYLVVSYFAAAVGGVVLALITAALLLSPAGQAFGERLRPVGRLFRRVLSPWLVLTAIFAFMTVSYFDCTHHTYDDVVTDRDHLEAVTVSQASRIVLALTIALFLYAIALTVALGLGARKRRTKSAE